MKTNLAVISIIIFSILFCNTVEAQKKTAKVKIDPEFETFWNDFQKAVKEDNKIQLSEFINFETFGITKVEFINSFKKNEPFEGITKKQILKTKISQFLQGENGDYAFDPYTDKEQDREFWNERNILNYLPLKTRLILIEYKYGKSFAGTTLVFAKKNGKYMLWEKRFQTYD